MLCSHDTRSWFSSKSDLDKALAAYQKALNIDLELFGEYHPYTGLDYESIGDIYKRSGDYDHALEFYQKYSAVALKTMSENHPYSAQNHDDLGGVYMEKGDFEQARKP